MTIYDCIPWLSSNASPGSSPASTQRERSPLISGPTKVTTMWGALLTLLKAFVGTGVLFLPHGFYSGGMLFGPFILSLVAFLTLYTMLKLLHCKESGFGHSYGSIGESAYGVWGRRMVQSSIVLMQAGFCCTYIIFVATNMSYVMRYAGYPVKMTHLILLQGIVHIPLSWIRYIRYLRMTNLIAHFFILYGVVCIVSHSMGLLVNEGIKPSVQLFNPTDYTVFIGTAIFTFEGIGLVIPTQNSLDDIRKAKFENLLIYTVAGLVVFYTVFAGINYAAFGSGIQPIVTSNLPRNGWSVSVQFGYSIAVLLSYPLFLLPAVRIVEENLFMFPRRRSGQKMQKNVLRSIMVMLTICVAYYGQDRLDLFVSLVGALCCVPLSFIYPPLFYLKLNPNASLQSKVADWGVVGVGILTFVFVSSCNVSAWYEKVQ